MRFLRDLLAWVLGLWSPSCAGMGAPSYLTLADVFSGRAQRTGWAPYKLWWSEVHVWREVGRDDNPNRIRTKDICENCRRERFGCLAKRERPDASIPGSRGPYLRLDPADRSLWWGPVGVQTYDMPEASPTTCPGAK